MEPVKPRVLTINGGSSSVKFALFEIGDSFKRTLEGGIDRMGSPARNGGGGGGRRDSDVFATVCSRRSSGDCLLSGGQSAEVASARLNAMNVRFKTRLPWTLAFSFARAIQQPGLEIWRGRDDQVSAVKQALAHRAKCNCAARRGEYATAMEGAGL